MTTGFAIMHLERYLTPFDPILLLSDDLKSFTKTYPIKMKPFITTKRFDAFMCDTILTLL